MAGNRTKLEARGFVHLLDDRAVDLRLSGPTDASLLSLLTEGLILSGPAELDVALTGTVDDLHLKGRYSLRDGRFVLDQPPLVAELLAFDLVLEGRTIELQNLTANLNGGKLKGSGRLVSKGRGQTPELQVQMEVDQFYLDYPYGLKTVSDVKLTAEMEGPNLVLGGVVKVVDGGFRDAIDIQLLAQLAAKPPAAPKPEESTAWQRRVKLNLAIQTAFPLYFDNNLAQMNADANVRVVGTLARPGLLGRIEVENGGKLQALERTFLMDRGVITFADDTKIDPVFDIAASTRVREYEITMRATGGLRDGTVTLTSDPAASEDQIYSLLFTGTVENSGKPMASAQRGLVSMFGSAIGGRYTLGIQRALGLSDFRVDPSFIANETNPTARLTIGQEVAPGAKIIYSTDLTDSKDQMWVGEYDWRRRVTARFIRQQDNSDRGEIRNKWDLGGGPGTGDAPRRKREAVRVGEVRFEGQTVLPEMELRKALGLKTGKKYDFTKVQKAVDKLGLYFARRGYPEARARLERTRRSETVKGRAANYVDLNFNIEAGRRTEFAFEGKEPPKKIREAALRAWRAGVVDTQRERMATDVLRRWLIREGYADAKVAAAGKPAGDGGRKVVFDLETGVHYGKPEIVFTGISTWRANEIRKGLKGQNLDVEMQNEPQKVADYVTGAMRADSFLSAKVAPPRIERDAAAKKQRAVIAIDPGKPYRYGAFRLEGLKVLDPAAVEEEFYVYPGDYYTPETRDELLLAVQGAYDRRGYREAAVAVDTVLRPESALVDLVFRVEEGRRNQIQAVRVEGTVNTSEEFVRRRLAVLEKELSDSAKLKQSRKNLIDSNAYKLVDVATEPLETKETPRNGEVRPVNLAVRLREAKPYRVEYGLLYDSDNGFGFVSDVSARNVLGEARWLGYRFLDDGLKTEHKIYVSQPFWGRRNIQTNGYISWQKEQREAFTATGTQYSVEQVVRFAERFDFTYGYQLTNVTVDFGLIPELGFPLSVSARLTPVISTFRRDTRDVILDATRGSFLSNAIEYGPTWLGANSAYYRWYGQAFKYFGLSRARTVPGSFDRKAPRWVYAAGVRAGFVDSIGTSQLVPTELFFAGGGTTVRGFEQDELGPKTPGGTPVGGKATLVINNEVRTPLWKWFDAVGFVDAGNVFARPSDFRLTDLRGSVGAGLRVRTPIVLLRFDYGWKIARRPGESAGAFFFSIGQAF
ncbi:MAG: translocation/assembly module TamB domain-containing protein [Bryobacter sp.]|nr:translocation/assembly module TamB domain-containing protein [Bryobacter sp.]